MFQRPVQLGVSVTPSVDADWRSLYTIQLGPSSVRWVETATGPWQVQSDPGGEFLDRAGSRKQLQRIPTGVCSRAKTQYSSDVTVARASGAGTNLNAVILSPLFPTQIQARYSVYVGKPLV